MEITRSGALSGIAVTFDPGARTAWHPHPLGIRSSCPSGSGAHSVGGGAIEEIRPSDIVYFAPGEKPWHGAGPDTAMSHIAIAEMQDGKVVDWMEKVSDAHYLGGSDG